MLSLSHLNTTVGKNPLVSTLLLNRSNGVWYEVSVKRPEDENALFKHRSQIGYKDNKEALSAANRFCANSHEVKKALDELAPPPEKDSLKNTYD